MNDVLQQFYETPTGEHYVRALAEVLSYERPGADTFLLQQLAQMVAKKQFVEVLEILDLNAPSLALSPQAHFLGAQAAEALQDSEELELRRFLLETCLTGILADSDGSQDSPYRVSWLEDQNLVLAALDHRPTESRTLARQQNRFVDVVDGSDGQRVHFDVTCQVCCRPSTSAAKLRQGVES